MGIILIGLAIILVFVLFISIIVFIVQAMLKRDKSKKNFNNLIRNIYIYLILIITLIIIISATIQMFNDGLDALFPEQTTSSSSYYSSERIFNRNITSMFTDLSILIVCIPIFIYHSKLAKKDRENKKVKDEVNKVEDKNTGSE